MEREILAEVELKARNGKSEIRVLEIKVASGGFLFYAEISNFLAIKITLIFFFT